MNNWLITESTFNPGQLHHRETVFTIGNGYLGTRGAFEEGYPGAMPATLIHGVFDDVPLVYTELANAPDWLHFVLVVDGQRFRMDRGEVLSYERTLDMRQGLLTRRARWQSPDECTVDIAIERFASLADPHVLAIRYQVTPLDFDGYIEFQAGINGHVDNDGLLHWHILDQGEEYGLIWLHSRTRGTGIELGQAAYVSISGSRDVTERTIDCEGCPTVVSRCRAEQGRTITAVKVVTIYTSRDLERLLREPLPAVDDVSPELQAEIAAFLDEKLGPPSELTVVDLVLTKHEELEEDGRTYDDLKEAHTAAWARTWRDSDVLIEGDDEAQRALRYNLFQLLIAAPREDDRVSIPAKTLSGFGYRGHVFWDTEIFMLPFFTFTQPELARRMLMYRYHTLPGARRKAQEAGYDGAMFAWESADAGDEVTPRWLPHWAGEGLVRIWTGDIEHHISADVAYAAWQYWQVVRDEDFFTDYGAEIILDTASFWGSRVEYNPERDRYEIHDVIGPDEWHEHVDNNAFTNAMTRWHLATALETLAWLRQNHAEKAAELEIRLDLNPERLAHWADVVEQMYVLHDPETGLIEQFEGFFQLEELDQAAYEPRTRAFQGLLGLEKTQKYQIIKQADVIMLLCLLGDQFDEQTKRANWDYYEPRTDHLHGSSLDPAFQSVMACQMGEPDMAYEHFMRAVLVDLEDLRHNTDSGIHGASAGGLWQAVVFGFGGVRLTEDGLVSDPRLPRGWQRLRLALQYRGERVKFDVIRDQ